MHLEGGMLLDYTRGTSRSETAPPRCLHRAGFQRIAAQGRILLSSLCVFRHACATMHESNSCERPGGCFDHAQAAGYRSYESHAFKPTPKPWT